MTDKRRHRGRHPDDEALFAPGQRPALRLAVQELSWLLTRGYSDGSAIKLVGDRHALTKRQRQAVVRCACAERSLAQRQRRCLPLSDLGGRPVALDGFNCVITLETALSGGLILVGRDGCLRDLSSIHGTYRAVSETPRGIELIGEALAGAHVGAATWYLDRPVSNSGRLKTLIGLIAARRGWPWQVELRYNPDRALAGATAELSPEGVVVSSDSWVLDSCGAWTNLLAAVVAREVSGAWQLDLGQGVSDDLEG